VVAKAATATAIAVASRSTRGRPAKTPLSRAAVIDAGLRVLADGGLAAVTMRRVATELDTGPASLYAYVANRDELLREMLDAVLGRVLDSASLEPPDPARWREQLMALLLRMLDALNEHPGIAAVTMAQIPTGTNALLVADKVLGLLRAGGVPGQSAAWAVDVIALYVSAAALEQSMYLEQGKDESAIEAQLEEVRERYGSLSPARYPNITAMLGPLTSGSGERRFAFGLDVFITGLLAVDEPVA
jgi:AcrR family transcriptional regulator